MTFRDLLLYNVYLSAACAFTCALICTIRLAFVLPSPESRNRNRRLNRPDKRSLAVFLGSGGHTTEALALLSNLDFTRYTPRTYIISEGDTLSANKAVTLENLRKQPNAEGGDYTIVTLPRARKVHQSILTTPFSALVSFVASIRCITIQPILSRRGSTAIFADVLILNGPGTCYTLCLAVYINKIFGLPAPSVMYVESFARVKRLSLSGKLLRPLVDRFIVQWPDLLEDRGRGEHHGWLV